MKNTLLIFAALVVSFKTQAQLSKGTMMLSGSFNYSKSHGNTVDSSGVAQQPVNTTNSFTGVIRYGYFVTNKIMVGVYGSYGNSSNYSKSTYFNGSNYVSQTSNSTGNSFSGGVFSRYYQVLGKSRFALFGQLSVGYGSAKEKVKTTALYSGGNLITSNSHVDVSTVSAGFNPGLVFFVTKNIAIETSFGNIGYSMQRSRNYDDDDGKGYREAKTSMFISDLGFSLSGLTWGVNFYFGGKKDKTEIPSK